MKKTVSLILAIIILCTTLFSLTACGGTSQEDTDKAVAEATAPLKAQIEALEKTISHAEARIADLEAENKTLNDEKTALTEENATLKAKVTVLEEKITELELEIARLKAALDGDTATLNAEVERLEAEVKTLKEEKAILTAKVTENEGKIAKLEATITAKNNEISTLNSSVVTLTTEKNTLTARVSELEKENKTFEAENKELEALVAALRNCLKGIHSYSGGVCIYCGAEQVDASYVRCDKDGTPNASGEYILFGEYPQTIKADNVTVTSTQDSRGYYLGSDGNYYAKITATPFTSTYTFSTGSIVSSGSIYYFKVEPIRWRILSEKNGEAFILCDSIIDTVLYQPDYTYDSSTGIKYTTANGAPEGTYANNYKYSNIRKWLNSTFYEAAFSSFESAKILTTEVDNSGKTLYSYGYTGTINSTYACENTNDKVFLLSRSEATNSAYGFASYYGNRDKARKMVPSDYSRARGVFAGCYDDTLPSIYGGEWWLRSPYTDDGTHARAIMLDGDCYDFNTAGRKNVGAVPALRIQL